jgi:hypothetical protein
MQKGFSVPILLVGLTLLVSLPLIIWVSANSLNLYSTPVDTAQVKGASTDVKPKPGFSVYVTSVNGTWDLGFYVCKTLEECTDSATSGKKISTVSGGEVSNHVVNFVYNSDWADYAYAKYFVKPSWGSIFRTFKVADLGEISSSKSYEVSADGSNFNAVVFSLDTVRSAHVAGGSFTDQ